MRVYAVEYDLYVIAIDTCVVEVVAHFGKYKAGYIHSFTRNVVVWCKLCTLSASAWGRVYWCFLCASQLLDIMAMANISLHIMVGTVDGTITIGPPIPPLPPPQSGSIPITLPPPLPFPRARASGGDVTIACTCNDGFVCKICLWVVVFCMLINVYITPYVYQLLFLGRAATISFYIGVLFDVNCWQTHDIVVHCVCRIYSMYVLCVGLNGVCVCVLNTNLLLCPWKNELLA